MSGVITCGRHSSGHSKPGANLPGDFPPGGKGNYPADGDTVGQIAAYLPNTREAHQVNRTSVRPADP
jgi:hypothetical protein